MLILLQGVTLTGRNATGPPRAAPGELRCAAVECYRRRQTTDNRRRRQNYTAPLHYMASFNCRWLCFGGVWHVTFLIGSVMVLVKQFRSGRQHCCTVGSTGVLTWCRRACCWTGACGRRWRQSVELLDVSAVTSLAYSCASLRPPSNTANDTQTPLPGNASPRGQTCPRSEFGLVLTFVHTAWGALRCVMCRTNQIHGSCDGSIHIGRAAVQCGALRCGIVLHVASFWRIPKDAVPQRNAPQHVHCERPFSRKATIKWSSAIFGIHVR